ncbi:Telomerase-binding protein EST1A [Acipenser ruthenus]|uniref:Telomerase-binding protein EST1A n=1 Tax=Acipenser ruthenus TaxID=7906 RepID=A0A444UDA0_ACIRT|nr:Telomerase-binding protein EST1A [Acipenser ruthenus]
MALITERAGGGGGSSEGACPPRSLAHGVWEEVLVSCVRVSAAGLIGEAVLQPCRQLEIEITPVFLVPDTNGFIDHLSGLAKLLSCKAYILVVPLIVITELDGLARGQETEYRTGSHARQVQEHARSAISFLERGFENREPCLRALTSRGNELESISFRSEDPTGQQGNNDDLILSCCLHYCKDKAKDFMPTQKGNAPGTTHRERQQHSCTQPGLRAALREHPAVMHRVES